VLALLTAPCGRRTTPFGRLPRLASLRSARRRHFASLVTSLRSLRSRRRQKTRWRSSFVPSFVSLTRMPFALIEVLAAAGRDILAPFGCSDSGPPSDSVPPGERSSPESCFAHFVRSARHREHPSPVQSARIRLHGRLARRVTGGYQNITILRPRTLFERSS
jgi:hypothetical protein